METKKNKTAIVYMVAGLSSRFGGKIKQFAKVGKNSETLIELSMQQAINAGFNKIIFIVGDKTEKPFVEKFGNNYFNTPIYYAKQIFDEKVRERPWGTLDALISAKKLINCPFAICNGDDLYGENALRTVCDFLIKNENKKVALTIGYKLKNAIPKKGSTNRGIYKLDKNNFVKDINEIIGIEFDKLKQLNLNENDLCSMNLFGLNENIFSLLEEKLILFKNNHKNEKRIECYLPVELSNLIKEKKILMKLAPTNDVWLGVTNPEDEETIKKIIKENK